jgi:hypothetical protein
LGHCNNDRKRQPARKQLFFLKEGPPKSVGTKRHMHSGIIRSADLDVLAKRPMENPCDQNDIPLDSFVLIYQQARFVFLLNFSNTQ